MGAATPAGKAPHRTAASPNRRCLQPTRPGAGFPLLLSQNELGRTSASPSAGTLKETVWNQRLTSNSFVWNILQISTKTTPATISESIRYN
jgi:hypothetical protein